MSLVHHEESAKIVNQAIAALGQGKKGLADRLNKDPSLISRYASGAVRPKAETLLECMVEWGGVCSVDFNVHWCGWRFLAGLRRHIKGYWK